MLRKSFDLYANLRPIKNLPGVPARYQGVDLIVVRENTEGLYSGIEHEVVPGVMESLKIITEKASTKIAKFAFGFAKKYRRKKVAAVHKANIMKLTDGLFLECARNVAKNNKGIGFSDIIVDNACMQLVLNPLQFDIFCDNLYGDMGRTLLRVWSGVCCGRRRQSRLCPSSSSVQRQAPDIKGKIRQPYR